MDFINKVKAVFIRTVLVGFIGVLFIVVGITDHNEMSAAMGVCFVAIMVGRVVLILRYRSNRKYYSAMNLDTKEEKEAMVWEMARGYAFSAYFFVSSIAVVIAYSLGLDRIGMYISYSLAAFVFIYFCCYLILKKMGR